METENTVRTRLHLTLYLLLALTMIGATADAQPTLNFKRVIVNWPTIELCLSVTCDGNPDYTMTKQDFRVYENGVEVTDFNFSGAPPEGRQHISVALVFDASGSMQGSGNAGAKMAGHLVVDSLDGVNDEAAILWYSTEVTVAQEMTRSKTMLNTAVDALPVQGSTALWDGTYAGLIELIKHGVHSNRAVIVMTDGGDAASSRQPDEIIRIANRHHIRVFTIAIGSTINARELEDIAVRTGGEYYQIPNPAQLLEIYAEILAKLFSSPQECIISYQKHCADSSLRNVEVELNNFCGESCSGMVTYHAPVDAPNHLSRVYAPSVLVYQDSAKGYAPNPFPVRLTFMNLGDALVSDVEGSIALPEGLELDPPDQLRIKQVMPSSIGRHFFPDPVPEVIWTLRWTKRYRYDVKPEIECTVVGRDCHGGLLTSTRRSPISVPGISPRFLCDAFDMPDSLALNAAGTDVEPNPFVVSFKVKNVGDNIGAITRLYINFPTSDGLSLDPASPNPMNQSMNLELDKDESRTFEWIIKVEKRNTRRLPLISVTALDDEGNPITCEDYLPIAGVGTVGSGSVPLPTTTRLEQNHPNPFNPTTTIEYHLGKAGECSLTLYDALGRMLRVLDSGHKPAGKHTFVFDASDLPSGVYLYKLETSEFSETKRMILSR